MKQRLKRFLAKRPPVKGEGGRCQRGVTFLIENSKGKKMPRNYKAILAILISHDNAVEVKVSKMAIGDD